MFVEGPLFFAVSVFVNERALWGFLNLIFPQKSDQTKISSITRCVTPQPRSVDYRDFGAEMGKVIKRFAHRQIWSESIHLVERINHRNHEASNQDCFRPRFWFLSSFLHSDGAPISTHLSVSFSDSCRLITTAADTSRSYLAVTPLHPKSSGIS